MHLSLSDGSNGLSGECHLAKEEVDCTSSWRPATDTNVLKYMSHSCFSLVSSGSSAGRDEVIFTHESSHDRVRTIDPMCGDLSIRFDPTELSGVSTPESIVG